MIPYVAFVKNKLIICISVIHNNMKNKIANSSLVAPMHIPNTIECLECLETQLLHAGQCVDR